MKHLVYKLKRKSDNKEYIGITIDYRLKNRLAQHRCHNRFKNDDFNFEILYKSDSRKEIEQLEPKLIHEHKTYIDDGGLNLSKSGKGYNHHSAKFTTLGFKFSKEAREKMSKKAKERYKRMGKEEWSKMIKRGIERGGAELRKKKSQIRKGRILSCKLSDDQIIEIRNLFNKYTPTDKVGKPARNGKILRKENEFSKLICNEYGISDVTIRNVLDKKCIR